jgi:cob(I)alamin adenosyltransferase
VTLQRSGELQNRDLGRWLNRLSLLLFVLGRYEESLAGQAAKPAKTSNPGRSN